MSKAPLPRQKPKPTPRKAHRPMDPDLATTPYSRMLRKKIQQAEPLRQQPQPDFDRWLNVTAPLLELLSLDNQLTHHPLDAMDAVIKSECAGVPPPPWASDIFKNILHDWTFMVEGFDLNKVFGVTPSGRGRTPEGLARLLARRDAELATNVLKLVRLGKPVLAACRAVAYWFLRHPWWSDMAVSVRPYRRLEDRGMQEQVEQFARTVKKVYYRYCKTRQINKTTDALFATDNPEVLAIHLAILQREGLLEQFPDPPWANK
jgi:hypothetical protein